MRNKALHLWTFFSLLGFVWGNSVLADQNNTNFSACISCHDTNSFDQTQAGPNLSGQNSTYLIEQIKLFRNNTRNHPFLSNKNLNFSHQDITNIAEYIQSMPRQFPAIVANKDAEILFEPCSACHGSQGEGVTPFPILTGQQPAYIEQQLLNFKNGTRQNSLMQAMTINLSEDDIKLIADYLGTPKGIDETKTGNIAVLANPQPN